jgi:hypothetical protein
MNTHDMDFECYWKRNVVTFYSLILHGVEGECNNETTSDVSVLLQRPCSFIDCFFFLFICSMTEARRIVALASAFDIPVIPHGSSVYSYHLQICFPSCPIAEFLVMSPKADKIVSYFGKLFKDEPLPKVR